MLSLLRKKKGSNNENSSTRIQTDGGGASRRAGERSSHINNESKKTAKTNQATATFRVKIPPNVRPNETFHVYVGTRLVKLKCPPNAFPGQSLSISVPKEDQSMRNNDSGLHSPNVTPINGSDPPAFDVTIPIHVRGGQQFPVTINGVDLMVTSPQNALPGMSVRIVPPKTKMKYKNKGKLFEVRVPHGVNPGKPFGLIANGIRISVKCPIDAQPGQTIRFYLPFRTTDDCESNSNFVVRTLNYDVDGWTRTLQISAMKFQWVRIQSDSNDFDDDDRRTNSIEQVIKELAYVTQISAGEELEFIPAQIGMVDSSVVSTRTGSVLANCTDLVAIQAKNFSDKVKSFRDLCKKIGHRGHSICIQVRREFLLEDSLEAVMSLNTEELQSVWRFQFMGEEGVDAVSNLFLFDLI